MTQQNDREPEKVDFLSGRVLRLEVDVERLGRSVQALESGNRTMAEQFASLRDESRKQTQMLEGLLDAVGTSPDGATGAGGRGMRGQVSMLVKSHEDDVARREKNLRRVATISAVVGVIAALAKVFHDLGVWK